MAEQLHAASCLMTGLLVAVSIRGLRLGKWVHNAGGVTMLLIFATLLALPVVNYLTGHLQTYRPLDAAAPPVTLDSLNILGKMGFGALGGFEYVAILAGEAKAPARTIGRSVRIAAPVIALMFILGTSSVLAFVPIEGIDLIGPIPRVLSIGFRSFGYVAYLVSIAILSMLALRLAQASVAFTAVTRLPMVAGWDRLLPVWFTRLHARHRTPVNSIFVVGLLMLVMGLVSLVGVGQQEAFQLLHNASGVFYALAYLVMFALPLVGLRRAGAARPWWLRATAASGFLMTLLYVALSVFPIIRVESRLAFAAKIAAVILVANAAGALIYLVARRKRPS